jgi:DNA-binding IclR family transcriptional regulator
VVYVETVQGRESNDTRPGIGSTRPFLRTAIGRALLYSLDAQERALVIKGLKEVQAEEWDKYGDRVNASLSEIDSKGYCIVDGDWQSTLAAVGVPMKKKVSGMPLAFNVTVPRYATDLKQLETDLAPRLLELVQNMEYALV